MRYDNFNHWVEFDKKKSRSRCKLADCNGFTHAHCTKCKLSLCCSVNRNCFRKFHKPGSANIQAIPAKRINQQRQKLTKNCESKKIEKHTNQITQWSSFKSVKSTTKLKKVQKNSNLCEDHAHSHETSELSNQSVGTTEKNKIVNLASLQSSQMVETEAHKRRNRRKNKHQVKPMSDEDLQFTEIDDRN